MELKPCPFCGRKSARVAYKTVDRTDSNGKLGTRSERYKIYCSSCPGQTSWGFYVEDVAEAYEVPPHGDLIDYDFCMKNYELLHDDNGNPVYAVRMRDINNAPTVIEAEEGET